MAAKKEEEKKPETPANKGKGKLLIAAVAGVIILGGGAFAVASITKDKGEEAGPAIPAEGAVVPLESFVVNLADKDAVRFARVGLAAVFVEGANPEEVRERTPLVRAAMLRVFVPKTSKDLTRLDGLDKLNEELTEAAKSTLPPNTVLRIVVTDAVVQ